MAYPNATAWQQQTLLTQLRNKTSEISDLLDNLAPVAATPGHVQNQCAWRARLYALEVLGLRAMAMVQKDMDEAAAAAATQTASRKRA